MRQRGQGSPAAPAAGKQKGSKKKSASPRGPARAPTSSLDRSRPRYENVKIKSHVYAMLLDARDRILRAQGIPVLDVAAAPATTTITAASLGNGDSANAKKNANSGGGRTLPISTALQLILQHVPALCEAGVFGHKLSPQDMGALPR